MGELPVIETTINGESDAMSELAGAKGAFLMMLVLTRHAGEPDTDSGPAAADGTACDHRTASQVSNADPCSGV